MVSSIRPALQSPPAAASTVTSPHAPLAPASQDASDSVSLTSITTPEPLAATSDVPETKGRKAALVAAGVTAAVLAGVLGPVLGGVLQAVPPDVVSQAVTLPVAGGVVDPGMTLPGAAQGRFSEAPPAASVETPQSETSGQPQRPGDIVDAMSRAAEQSAQILPQANAVHAEWSKDLKAMKATVHEVSGHVDALLRNGKKDAESHRSAIDAGLTRLAQQSSELRARLGREQPAVDQFLGQNRDNLNQIGTIAYNLERSIDQAASQQGYFSPQRQALRELGKDVHTATVDMAMSTEKATSARALDKALVENLNVVDQIIGQVQQANDASKTQAGALSQLDEGARMLENAFKVLDNVVDQSVKTVDESASRAHRGAVELAAVARSLGAGDPAASSGARP